MDVLTPTAGRVLGSLLEKELTVPATYPLTLASVVAACNQTTGRDPIVTLDEAEATSGIEELRRSGLVRLVHPSHGARSVKYRQVADAALGLDGPGRAVITLLVLRGPQTSGELRSRSDRLHPFDSVDEVEHALGRLADRDEPLVVLLDRRPGQKEQRWGHLLSGPPGSAAVEAASPVGGFVSDDAPAPAPTSVAAVPTIPLAIPPEVAALGPFIGTWIGAGEGAYPTISPFGYTEEIELRPLPGKPIVAYRSSTRARDDGRPLHSESGFLRVVADGSVELVVAQGSGVVEAAEGLVDGDEIIVVSTVMAGTTTAKSVTATERRYRVEGDTLTYELSMAAVGQPLQLHLRATLGRPV